MKLRPAMTPPTCQLATPPQRGQLAEFVFGAFSFGLFNLQPNPFLVSF
jgi:hypothetical protein